MLGLNEVRRGGVSSHALIIIVLAVLLNKHGYHPDLGPAAPLEPPAEPPADLENAGPEPPGPPSFDPPNPSEAQPPVQTAPAAVESSDPDVGSVLTVPSGVTVSASGEGASVVNPSPANPPSSPPTTNPTPGSEGGDPAKGGSEGSDGVDSLLGEYLLSFLRTLGDNTNFRDQCIDLSLGGFGPKPAEWVERNQPLKIAVADPLQAERDLSSGSFNTKGVSAHYSTFVFVISCW